MELWDVYDKEGRVTGRKILRGAELQQGEYHLVVHIWIINSMGQILIQKRPDHFVNAPGIWATTGGAAIQGEDSRTAACREMKEELGIDINPTLKPIRHIRNNAIADIWVVKQDIDLKDIVLQQEEVSDVKWVSRSELRKMIINGQFYRYSDKYFELLSKYIPIF